MKRESVNWPAMGLAACFGLMAGLHFLPDIESTYELTATTSSGHVFVLDYDMSESDCLAALPRDGAGYACEVRHRHSTKN